MEKSNDGFIKGRIKSISFSVKGMWLLVKTEDSIKAQIFFGLIATFLGFYFNISMTEWIIQCMLIGMILVAEGLNTAIEKLADFIHPDYHKKIGFIKDIAAGAPGFAVLTSLIIACIIYLPKII